MNIARLHSWRTRLSCRNENSLGDLTVSIIGKELMSLLTGLEPDGVIAVSVFSNEPDSADCVLPVQVSAVETIYI